MKKSQKTFVIFIAVLVLLIFFQSLNWLAPLENLIKRRLAPLQAKIYRTGLFFSRKKSSPELTTLETRIHELLAENVKLQIFKEENKILRQELQFQRENKSNAVIANIIGRTSNEISSSFILDKGVRDGLKLGYAVTSHGIFLGKITKVEKNTAHVLSSLASSSQVAAVIISQDSEEIKSKHISGLVKGKHGLGMELELILSEGEAKPGDMVITSGLENNIPKGLIVGQISQVETQPGALFQKAGVKPLASFDKLSIVSIIIP